MVCLQHKNPQKSLDPCVLPVLMTYMDVYFDKLWLLKVWKWEMTLCLTYNTHTSRHISLLASRFQLSNGNILK